MQHTTGMLSYCIYAHHLGYPVCFLQQVILSESYQYNLAFSHLRHLILFSDGKSHMRDVYLIFTSAKTEQWFEASTLSHTRGYLFYLFIFFLWFTDIEELKFAVKELNWPEKQQKINSLHVKYPAVWNADLE